MKSETIAKVAIAGTVVALLLWGMKVYCHKKRVASFAIVGAGESQNQGNDNENEVLSPPASDAGEFCCPFLQKCKRQHHGAK